MELFELVKSALRVTTDDEGIESEIKQLISTAKEDLITAGVKSEIANDDEDELVRMAIIFYCKSAFGFDNPDAGRFKNMYENKRDTLANGVGRDEE